MISLKKLEPKEVAVLGAILTLRLNSGDNVFEYDCKEVQNNLNLSGDLKEFLITLDEQQKIVMDLSKKRILNTDQIIDNRFNKMFRLHIDPYCIDVSGSRSDFFWANQTRWAYKIFQEDGRISIEDVYAKYGDTLFIKMDRNEIKNLSDNYRKDHIVYLKLNIYNRRLCIKFDDRNWINLPTFHDSEDDNLPYKILEYAWKRVGKEITLKEMSDKGLIDKKDTEKYFSNIFQKNGTVKALRPKLIDWSTRKRSFILRGAARCTYNELCDLRNVLKI